VFVAVVSSNSISQLQLLVSSYETRTVEQVSLPRTIGGDSIEHSSVAYAVFPLGFHTYNISDRSLLLFCFHVQKMTPAENWEGLASTTSAQTTQPLSKRLRWWLHTYAQHTHSEVFCMATVDRSWESAGCERSKYSANTTHLEADCCCVRRFCHSVLSLF
jgi:hypothetical protein